MAHHVCPWWMGYVLVNPLRKLIQNPEKILSPHIESGMTVLDVGCAMGYFSIDMAKLAGSGGNVICVDMQPRMIQTLINRSEKAGLKNRIDTVICREDSLGIDSYRETVDFAFAFYIVHEVLDASVFIEQIHGAIKPSGKLLVAEPMGHISNSEFEESVKFIQDNGFKKIGEPKIFRSHTILLERI